MDSWNQLKELQDEYFELLESNELIAACSIADEEQIISSRLVAADQIIYLGVRAFVDRSDDQL